MPMETFTHGVLSGVLAGALVGAGATSVAMKLTLLPQYLLMLPLLAISVFLGHGLSAAMAVFLGSASVTAILFAHVWRRGRWGNVEL